MPLVQMRMPMAPVLPQQQLALHLSLGHHLSLVQAGRPRSLLVGHPPLLVQRK
jgi:hypothetical protein